MLDHSSDRHPSTLAHLADKDYPRRQIERNELLQTPERLPIAEAIEAASEWLKMYYKTRIELEDSSTLAHYQPDQIIDLSQNATTFTGADNQYRVLYLERNDLAELIHEISHIIVAEPHELRQSNYGLVDNQPHQPTQENEARTAVMQRYLLRQAGWPNQTIAKLRDEQLEYVNDDDWNGVDFDFPGKSELIEILKRVQ
jgi:hypothetical protein